MHTHANTHMQTHTRFFFLFNRQGLLMLPSLESALVAIHRCSHYTLQPWIPGLKWSPASVSWVLGVQACVTEPSCKAYFDERKLLFSLSSIFQYIPLWQMMLFVPSLQNDLFRLVKIFFLLCNRLGHSSFNSQSIWIIFFFLVWVLTHNISKDLTNIACLFLPVGWPESVVASLLFLKEVVATTI